MSTFTHHPPRGWTYDPTRTYGQNRPWCKPNGFWLSVDDDWMRWCRGEEYNHHDHPGPTFAFDVDTERCLWLRTVSDIDEFTWGYATANSPMRSGKPDFYHINWAPLTEQYAGIIIAPYQWERRLHGDASEWYYSWDCASACVWDLTVVVPITAEAPAWADRQAS